MALDHYIIAGDNENRPWESQEWDLYDL